MTKINSPRFHLPARLISSTLLATGLGVALIWSYWPTLMAMADRWSRDPLYSHGYLVPMFSLIFLTLRRHELALTPNKPSWWGAALILAAFVLRLVGAFFYFPWLDGITLPISLAGVCLLIFGKQVLAIAWPAIAFLVFMLPLPYRLEVGMRQPLQKIATLASTYALQTLGCSAFSEGNVIIVNRTKMGVEDACSGLGMLLVFFALSTALAILIKRPFWERILVFLSAVPIAIVANIIRITATGTLYQLGQSAAAKIVFHDLAGWLMMPLALALMWVELLVLSRLLVVIPQSRPVPVGFPSLENRSPSIPNSKAKRRGRSHNGRESSKVRHT